MLNVRRTERVAPDLACHLDHITKEEMAQNTSFVLFCPVAPPSSNKNYIDGLLDIHNGGVGVICKRICGEMNEINETSSETRRNLLKTP